MKNIRHYNNGTILTPHKCGTKYLNRVFNITGSSNVIQYKDLFTYDFKWLIVRDPYEHLLSAITTVYNTKHKSGGFNSTLLTRFIDGTDAHWNNTFYQCVLPHSLIHPFKLVELSNLTHFVEHELGLNAPPFLNRYGTQIIYMSKDNLINKIKLEYSSEWEILMELVELEKSSYSMLFDRCDVYNSNLR